jgi:hypothetical protein
LTWSILAFACVCAARAQGETTDSAFSVVPFDRWVADGEQTHYRWSVHVGGAELTSHQRLVTRVEISVDGNELVNRRGHGELVIMIQFQDSSEHVYGTHGVLDLQDVRDEVGKSNIQYMQDALVLPGDYRVSVVIFDAKTKEHSALQKTLHVNPLHNDPLPGAWKDLPTVELLHGADPPDSWYLPYLTGRLQLPLTTRRPVQIEILMNAASSASRGLSAGTVNNRSMANMVPALKVFSQLNATGAGMNITLLDLPKRNILFRQDAVRELDWMRLREALAQADPNKIDVHSLEHSEQNAQYFVEQVRLRLALDAKGEHSAEAPLRVLIVLAGPLTFSLGENKRPIEVDGKPDGKVYYLRYHLPPDRVPAASLFDSRSRAGRRGPGSVQQQPAPEAFDSLEPLLKPLQPRLFEVYTPDQFRKALSVMLDEIARL